LSADRVQIFVSYARNDDLQPPDDPGARGFVTALRDDLEYQLTLRGEPRPTLWLDRSNVEDGDQFDPIIREAIEASSLFVVVLSRNWLHRPYCLEELQLFRERWAHEDDFTFIHRITVVRMNEVDEEQCPKWVTGQVGYKFYKFVGRRGPGNECLFFDRGKVEDGQYYQKARDLGAHLWTRSMHIVRRDEILPPPPPPPPSPPPSPKGHTIYLATPATDMREPYNRLVKELTAWGHSVVPDPTEDVPEDSAAIKFFEDALSRADISIHLLGEKRGFSLDDDHHEPIVPLQLTLAGQRATTLKNGAPKGFRRIIWAPKLLPNAHPDTDSETLRDPAAVVAHFGGSCDTDSIVGDGLSKFVEFLCPHLARSFRDVDEVMSVSNGATIYLNHKPEDLEYAINLAKLLKQRNAKPVLRATQGQADELLRYHRDHLRGCDSVVVCWAAASEVAARVMWDELDDWRAIGRTQGFTRRGLVAGPPPGPRKKNVDVLFPTSKIDVIVDLTSRDQPAPDDLNPLFGTT